MTHERFSPEMYVRYYAAHKGISIEEIGVAPVVVLSWGQKVVQDFAEMLKAQRCEHWFYDEGHVVYPLYSAEVRHHQVSFVQCPEGASATVMMMEEMIACGAKVFLSLGWAGSLQRFAPIGMNVVPTRCISEEGTSLHYPCDMPVGPDEHLVKLLQFAAQTEGVETVSGIQWSTDAPYRELLSKIESYQQLGVIGVDMETSAMYALGRFRDVKVCNLLVISDELWSEWRPAFRSAEVLQATAAAQRVVLKCLDYYFAQDGA